jgi:hypothetical protein
LRDDRTFREDGEDVTPSRVVPLIGVSAAGGKGARLKGTREKLSDARCEDHHRRDLLTFTD